MDLVVFAYGLAFFTGGLLIGVQARLWGPVLSRRALGFFAAFAVIHGALDWGDLLDLEGPRLTGMIFARTLTFALLAQFGVEVLRDLGHCSRWCRAVPLVLVLIWAVLAVAAGAVASDVFTEPRAVEPIGRYLLALPGAVCAGVALLAQARRRRASLTGGADPVVRPLLGAGVALLAYALLAGIVVPRAPYYPAAFVNEEVFRELLGVPVEVARAGCAVVVCVFLIKAIALEGVRERMQWDQRREEFISVIAHDLRSPVTAIYLAEQMLERGLDAEALDRVRPLLRNIATGARSLERMVEDLLDASSVETRRLSLVRESVDMASVLRSVVDRQLASLRGHPVRAVVAAVPPVEVDPHRIEQIVTNLLSNAAKYARDGSEITVALREHRGELEVAVTNLGRGIAPDDLERVFTRFYRSRPESGSEGLGLGLYIARGLVEAHGGRIWVESELGASTTFHFTLPGEVRGLGGPAGDAAE